jgi:hypothetical protein
MTEEDEEFDRMLAKVNWQNKPSKDSQLVSLRRWEIDEMIRLAVWNELEECAKVCERYMESYDDVAKKTATKCVIDIRNRQKLLDKPNL